MNGTYIIPVSLTLFVTITGLLSTVLVINNNVKKIMEDQKNKNIKDWKIYQSVEKIEDVDKRLSNIEDISENRSLQIRSIMSDRKVIMSSLYTILENMQKLGANGNTEKRMNELRSHLIDSVKDVLDEDSHQISSKK